MKIEGYKCPNCGGTVKFDSSAQLMKCPYCDTEFELAALEAYQKELEAIAKDGFGWKVESEEDWEKSELDNLTAGSCPSCGAELYGNENTVAEVCPCCGNAQIMVKRLSGTLKPDYVIPFKRDKRAAVGALRNFCEDKRLLPKYFIEENVIGRVQGVYVPFWLFDANARGQVSYKATKVRQYTSGGNRCTETSHYSVIREGSLDFEKIPVDASEKMDDEFMDAIEPFNYREMKDFHRSFLAGYVAEKYDVSAEACKPRAEKRIKATIEEEFKKSVTGYHSVSVVKSRVSVKEGNVGYGLFPVWVLNTKYNGENYQFMMNGQTGLLAGRLPVDEGKVWGYRAMFAGLFWVVLSLLSLGLYHIDIIASGTGLITGMFIGAEIVIDPSIFQLIIFSLLVSIAIGFLIVRKWQQKMDTVHLKAQADDYMIPDSLSLSVQKDIFLYKTVVRIPRKSGGKGAGGLAGAAIRIGGRRR